MPSENQDRDRVALECGCWFEMEKRGKDVRVDYCACSDDHGPLCDRMLMSFSIQNDMEHRGVLHSGTEVYVPRMSEIGSPDKYAALVVAEARRFWQRSGRMRHITMEAATEDRASAVLRALSVFEREWVTVEVTGMGPEAA